MLITFVFDSCHVQKSNRTGRPIPQRLHRSVLVKREMKENWISPVQTPYYTDVDVLFLILYFNANIINYCRSLAISHSKVP